MFSFLERFFEDGRCISAGKKPTKSNSESLEPKRKVSIGNKWTNFGVVNFSKN